MVGADPARFVAASTVALGDTTPRSGSSKSLTRLRLAVLAPIAWRVPPRHYGPWEQFASLLTEGLVAKGARRDVVRERRLGHVGAARVGGRPWLLGGSRRRAQGRRVPPHRARVRAGRRVRRDPQQLRLSSADLQRARRHAGAHDDPRVLLAAHPPRLREATTRRPTTSRSATPTAHPSLDYLATIHHGIDTDAFALSTSARATTCSSSAGSTPTRAPPRRSTSPLAAGMQARDRRHRPGSGLLRRAGRAHGSTATAISFIGAVGAGRAIGAPRRRGRPAPPDRLRRAVRLQRRRGDGLRHTGDRVRPRLDGRADRGRRDRLPRRRRRRQPSSPSSALPASTGPRSASRRSSASASGEWSTSTSRPTTRSSARRARSRAARIYATLNHA